jgi:hypothetical protein
LNNEQQTQEGKTKMNGLIQSLVVVALAQGQGVVMTSGGQVAVFNADPVRVDFGGRRWVPVEPAKVIDCIRRDPRTRDLAPESIAAAWIAAPHPEIDQELINSLKKGKKSWEKTN